MSYLPNTLELKEQTWICRAASAYRSDCWQRALFGSDNPHLDLEHRAAEVMYGMHSRLADVLWRNYRAAKGW